MALQHNWTHSGGYVVPNAYIRIHSVSVSHGPFEQYDNIRIEVRVYESEEIRRSDNPENTDMWMFYIYSLDDTQPITFSNLYSFLKNTDELSGATDV